MTTPLILFAVVVFVVLLADEVRRTRHRIADRLRPVVTPRYDHGVLSLPDGRVLTAIRRQSDGVIAVLEPPYDCWVSTNLPGTFIPDPEEATP